MMVPISHAWRLATVGLLALIVACGGGSDATSPATPQGVACDPRVGIYATATQGSPSAASNAAVADVVRKLQQSTGLGFAPVNKVSGAEEAGSVHYQVFYFVDTLTYRLVDSETAVVLKAGSAPNSVDEFLAFLQSDVRRAIDTHDQALTGSGVPAEVAAGACVDLKYSVNSTQGRVVARSNVGTLAGTAQADGSSTFRVSGGTVESLRLAIPAQAVPGVYAVSVQGVCRYAPSKVIANLSSLPVQVKAASTSAVSIVDDFANLDGGPHHAFALEAGVWGLGIRSQSGDPSVFLSGKASVTFGSRSGATVTRASIVAHDSCWSAGCTTVTIEGFDAQGVARSVKVESADGKRITVDSAEQGFSKVTHLRLSSLEASFSQLRATGTVAPAACTL
jgi:hypothetical protein